MTETKGPVKMLRISEKIQFSNSPSTQKEIISVNQDTPINRNKLKITLILRKYFRQYKYRLEYIEHYLFRLIPLASVGDAA